MSENDEPVKRGPWYLLFGLFIGLVCGLLIAWLAAPVTYMDTAPVSLRSDFKDQYRRMIAAAYLANGDLGRAESRLALLGDEDPAQALIDEARHLAEAGDPDGDSAALLALAEALGGDVSGLLPPGSGTEAAAQTTPGRATATPRAGSAASVPTPTPRPTRTSTPTPGAGFELIDQVEICDANLPGGLLQIAIQNAASQPVAGAEILVSWDGGQDHIFTGLKPELGNGYADFSMTVDILYSVQILPDSRPVTNLSAPSCPGENDETFPGSLHLTFRQP